MSKSTLPSIQEKNLPTVSEAFYCTCRHLPEHPAQLFNPELYSNDHNGRFTYAQLKERVEHLACGLMSLGLPRQAKVAIMSPSSPYWTQVDLALACCALTSVTIYPTLSINETSYIINDSQCKCIFVGNRDILTRVMEGIDLMPSLEKVIVMDMDYVSNDNLTIGFSELISMGKAYARDNFAAYEERLNSVTLEDVYTILYTSGTTGQGKGVVLTHWSPASRMEGTLRFFEKYGMVPTEKDTTLCFLPLSHIFDRGSCQLMAIWQGSCIAYADSPATLLDDMQKYNPTWINCVPRLYEKIYITFQQKLADSPIKKRLFDWAISVGEQALAYRTDENGGINMSPDFDLVSKLPLGLKIKYKMADRLFAKIRALFGKNFKFSFSASAAIAPDLARFYYTVGLAVCEGYGSTESFNACILNPLTACRPGRMGINANGGISRIAPDGELELSGAGIFKEYLNKPEDTKESFTDDGWFKTGDLVEIDEHGYYRMVDRKKAIICLAIGKNVAPTKIENLFSTSNAVEQLFIIGDERNYITALIVPNYAYFMDLFDKQNVSYDKSKIEWMEISQAQVCAKVGQDFIEQPLLKETIAQEVATVNQQLEEFERIKKYAILPQRFTEEAGELTPTLKVKKRVVLEKYKDIIEGLY